MAEPFPRPLGLFLQGGGSLGAWQAGALEALDAAGFRFDRIMGYSIGALNGAALAFGRLPDALARWRALDWHDVLRPSPRWPPLSLFSPEPLQGFPAEADDEATAKASLRAELTVISSCPSEDAPINARYAPGGNEAWDGPLRAHLDASCAIPRIFPPVDVDYHGRRLRLVDGGIPTSAPLDFSPLAGCAALLVLEMMTADEVGRPAFSPWRALDQSAREASRALVDGGLAGLRGPTINRLAPSRRLAPMILDFRAAGLRAMLAQGGEDARAFLARPHK